MKRTGIALLLLLCAVPAFGAAQLQTAETPCLKCWPVVGDFNGDGLDDFIGTYAIGSRHSIQDVYFNVDGHFGPAVTASGLEGNFVIKGVGDFNGDGRDDLVVRKAGDFDPVTRNYAPGGPDFLKMNAGSGRFVNGNAPPGYVVQVTDFDADGRADLVLLDEDNTGLKLARNNGNGTFAIHQTLPFPDSYRGTTTPPFAVGDLNSDGRPDLVQQRGRYLHFYFAGADGQFSAPRSRYTYLEAREPSIADVNGDARPDVVFIAIIGAREVRVTALFGDGTGRFPGVSHIRLAVEDRFEWAAFPQNLAVADFYAGGANEIAAGVNTGYVVMLSAMGNQLHEVARLDIPSRRDTRVYGGRFRTEAPADLLVTGSYTRSTSPYATDLVFTTGAVESPAMQARGGLRARANRRAIGPEAIDGVYDITVQSPCAANLTSQWTVVEEGLFIDFITASGIRSEAVLIDGTINARFFVEEGTATRRLEGELMAKGNVLQGALYEDFPPCGGLWTTHKIEGTR